VQESSDPAGDLSQLNFLGPATAVLVHQLGFVHPDQFKQVVHEAIIPVLMQHRRELEDMQAASFASVLSDDDMKAAIAFYRSRAGKDLVRIHAAQLDMNFAGVSHLLETLKPEIKAKARAILSPKAAPKG